jgi:hypothetical protein
MRLDPASLVVTSFETAVPAPGVLHPLATPTCPIFPTPATQCFVCPPATSDC